MKCIPQSLLLYFLKTKVIRSLKNFSHCLLKQLFVNTYLKDQIYSTKTQQELKTLNLIFAMDSTCPRKVKDMAGYENFFLKSSESPVTGYDDHQDDPACLYFPAKVLTLFILKVLNDPLSASTEAFLKVFHVKHQRCSSS